MASLALMVASCGDNKKTEETAQTTEQQAPATEASASQDAEAVNVTIEGTDQMTFSVKEIKAKAGQTIKNYFNEGVKKNNQPLLKRLSDKIIQISKREPTPDMKISDFIQQFLKDYNYYTGY